MTAHSSQVLLEDGMKGHLHQIGGNRPGAGLLSPRELETTSPSTTLK